MKFEISYGSGVRHEVELNAAVAVFGRAPNCDVVLNDSKCSRRHAVVEQGPDGLTVRDAGSANGIFVNGRRVRSAPLRPGDELRLGDVTVSLLGDVGETLIAAPEDLDLQALGLAPTRRPPPDRPPAVDATRPATASTRRPALVEPAAPRARAQPPERPLTVTVLSTLWALAGPALAAAVVFSAQRLRPGLLGWLLVSAAAVLTAGLCGLMAFGLLAVRPWARPAQLATAAVGLFVCPLSLTSATVLLYMTRPETKHAFGRAATRGAPPAGEPAFALTVVATLLLGVAFTAALAALFGTTPRP